MPTRVGIVDRIIIAVAIQIQSVYRLGGKISRVIRRDKSSPFGTVVTRVEIVQTDVVVVIIASVANGVAVREIVVGGIVS